jgi:glycosyltransferase involved in cell wall biosynthesis
MKIAVNTRLLLSGRLEGIGRFTDEILRRLVIQHPEVTFYFLFDRPYDPSFVYGPNVKPVVLGPPTRHPLLWYLWFEWRVPRWIAKNEVDLFLSPDGYGILHPSVPVLPVIHDLNFEHQPENLPPLTRWYYRTFFPKFAESATRVATVSTYSKNDIAKLYPIPAERIDVVYNAASEGFDPISPTEIAVQRTKWANGQPYLIYVGALNPRKNIPTMLRAFDRYLRVNGTGIKFLITGEEMYLTPDMKEAFEHMEHPNEVVFTGRLEAGELHHAVGGALALLLVSNFEGFGIPLVEAMKAGVPVIASNCTSLPEVVGDAGLLVEPSDEAQIAAAIHRMVSDEAFRATCIKAGFEQHKKFNWDRSSEALWHSIEACVKQGHES